MGSPPLDSFAGDGLRRMVYAHKVRMEKDSIFGAFDCPDAGQSLPRRRQSTTPIQALNLLNSRFILEQSEAFARRIQNELPGQTSPAWVRHMWNLAYARDPDPEELSASIRFLETNPLSGLCRVIYNSNEFLFIP